MLVLKQVSIILSVRVLYQLASTAPAA